jgi:hypothetical protein
MALADAYDPHRFDYEAEASEHDGNQFRHSSGWDERAIVAARKELDETRALVDALESRLRGLEPSAAVELREFISDLEGTTLYTLISDLKQAEAV